jgi:hypothetical protein
MDDFTDDAEGEKVVDLVLHEDAILGFGESMAMVPNLVGAGALVIDKEMPVFYLPDFCDPVHPDERHQSDLVANDLTFLHLIV